MTNFTNNQIKEFILNTNNQIKEFILNPTHKTYSRDEMTEVKRMISRLTINELEDILNNNHIHYQMFYIISNMMGLSSQLQNNNGEQYYLPILDNKVFKYRGKPTTISRINILN
jgi:hypothetical protein